MKNNSIFPSDLYYDFYDSLIGRLLLASKNNTLYCMSYSDKPMLANPSWQRSAKQTQIFTKELKQYFQGKLKQFSFKINIVGTDFQKKVLTTLYKKVMYGDTTTYSQLAHKANNPKAVRAVGSIMAYNPITIVVPCHRVIGSDGKLTGYGGGLKNKKFLLDLEQSNK